MDESTELERVKRELEEYRQRTARLEQRTARLEEETRKTTLTEYIEACHNLVFTKFTVETNKMFTSTGGITRPARKLCPPRLEPWTDFLREQRRILGTLFTLFPADTKAFASLHYLMERGEAIAAKRVGDENALTVVLDELVAMPVTSIMESFRNIGDIKDEFINIESGIVFETRVSSLGNAAWGSTEPPRTPDGRELRPDQICAYKRYDGGQETRLMAYIIEHKAPHKLTLPHLRLGLRPMDIYKEVVNRPTIPVPEEKEATFQYHADRLTAAAVTQTFDYMVQAGLTYGCLVTGEAFVFLQIDWTHPITLRYHLAEPKAEVDDHREYFLYCTAISQVLGFTVMALQSQTSQVQRQDDRQMAIDSLKTWAEDVESILRSIPLSERAAPPTSPAYKPRTYKDENRSPFLFRKTQSRVARRSGCRDSPVVRRRSPEPDDDSDETRMPDTPTPAQRRNTQRGLTGSSRGNSGNTGSSSSSQRAKESDRQYCTQKCLLGLVAGHVLDEECPNVTLHRGTDGDRRHPVDHISWLGLLREQLRRTLDDGVVPLWKQGSRGVLFQVTLLTYGYTFVSKATAAAFIQDLEHEAKVYERLRPLQGVYVPVFLGAVDLQEVGRTYYYYYDIHVRLTHMMFLSWGGRSLEGINVLDEENVTQAAAQSIQALHMRGVLHTDVRRANVLWDEETKRVMVIDFEQAVLLECPRPALGPGENTTAGKAMLKSDEYRARLQFRMHEEIWLAQTMF